MFGETVSTQVVNESDIQAEISAQKMVAQFKDILAGLRVRRVTATQEKLAVRNQILSAIQSRNELIAMFKNEVHSQFPDVVDVGQSLKSSAQDSPIRAIWYQYKESLDPITSDIASLLEHYKALSEEIEVLKEQEGNVLDDYAGQSSGSSVPVPSVAEIKADLVAVEAIPYSEDAEIFASIPAIELLDPDTADAITLEQANLEEQAAVQEAQAAVQTMVAQEQLGISRPTLIFGGLLVAYLLFR